MAAQPKNQYRYCVSFMRSLPLVLSLAPAIAPVCCFSRFCLCTTNECGVYQMINQMRGYDRRNGNNLCRFSAEKWMSAHFIISIVYLSFTASFRFRWRIFLLVSCCCFLLAYACLFPSLLCSVPSQLCVFRSWTHSTQKKFIRIYELCGKCLGMSGMREQCTAIDIAQQSVVYRCD